MIGSIRRFPRFIKAKNEEELQMKIMRLQFITGKEYPFLTIYPIKNGVCAWFYGEDSKLEVLKDAFK